ncbi:MAG: TonB-dependent receptor [Bacteroidales bacterium]|nr:TonB-dependent receptor [Bacteroidales bacterium]
MDKRLLFGLILFVGVVCCGRLAAQERYVLSGKVADSQTREAILYANVVVRPLMVGTSTNDKGEFVLRGLPAGRYQLVVTYIGYEEAVREVTLEGDQRLSIALRGQSLGLDEVVVTAENIKSGTTSSRIRSEAISHVQASSLKDVLQLIPGHLSENPNLASPSKISIREVGTNTTSALGTSVIIDGIPLSNDGNMQQSIYSGEMPSVAGTGVDMRGITVNNIESVTVDVGIPSAEYGNLTSGAVHIKTKAGRSPLTVRFKADPRTKQGSFGKGFLLGKTGGVLNLDADYTRSYGHIIKRTSLYNRLTGTAKYAQTFFRERSPLTLEVKSSWGSNLDGEKWDPDMLLLEENYSRQHNFLGAVSLSWSLNKPWISNLSFDGGLSRDWQKGFEKLWAGSSSGATFYATSTTDGEFEINYAPAGYYSEVNYDGRPYDLFLKLKAAAYRETGAVTHSLLAGIQWTTTGNNGEGRTFNPERPPVGLGTRPRPFYDIPALDQFSLFAEDKMAVELGTTHLEVMAGVRMDNIEPEGPFRSGASLSVDPRINLRYQLLNRKNNKLFSDLSLRAGYGRTTKAPTLIHLYPDKDYNDIVSFNYYPELIVATTAVVEDTRNPGLEPAHSTKKEVGLDFGAGGITGRITAFSEKHEGGFVTDNILFPQFYRDYDVLAAGYTPWYVPGEGVYYADPATGAPIPLGYEEDVRFAGYSRTMNGEVRLKKGIEYSLDLGKIEPLRTSININGAYFRTESYLFDAPYWERINYTVFDGGVSKQESFAVKFPDQYGYGTVDERLNTTVGLITHIPELKLLLSLTTQVIWFEKNRRVIYPSKAPLYTLSELRTYLGIPDLFSTDTEGALYYFLPVSWKGYDNVERPYTRESFQDQLAQTGIEKLIATWFPERVMPPLALCNVKVSKDIMRRFRLSFYANNFLNIRPWHLDKRSGRYMHRNDKPFFGADLTMNF